MESESMFKQPLHDKSAGKGGKSNSKSERSNHNPTLNSCLFDPKVKNELITICQGDGVYESDGSVEGFSDPFHCCILSNFINNEPFLDGLKNELLDQIFVEKNNDLYKFQQTEDMKKMKSPHAKALRSFFRTEVRTWLQEITGIELTNKVDITCSRYDFTDTLLCHDDDLEGRRIAFILYLTPPWKQCDGGSLQLFNTDDHGQPKDIVKTIVPKWNNFLFFLVDPVSFHQVSEVLTEDKTRLSLNGWFHGPPIYRPQPHIEPDRLLLPHIEMEQTVVYSWINPIYLDEEVQTQILHKFKQDSEIELKGFFKDDKYSELCMLLSSEAVEWEVVGPPNKRHYYRAKEENLPELLEECLRLFQSEAMFLTLSNLTGLKLHHMAISHSDSESETESESDSEQAIKPTGTEHAPKRVKLDMETDSEDESTKVKDDVVKSTSETRNPRCYREIGRWKQGCYTLLHDTDTCNAQFTLDARMTFNHTNWTQTMGGYVSYIGRGEDEELLTVNPAENSLALVYRDKNTLRAVKHVNNTINQLSGPPEFTDLSYVYYE